MMDRVFQEGVGPLLAPLGFSGRGGLLRKDGWVLEILPGADRFEVGVGKGGKSWSECPERTTLGELWKGKPYHWKMNSPADIKPAVEQVTVLVLELALPWFQGS
ncbi:hypothetical protein ABS71_16835 [bacterium SCN 62-11]|nr:hypothetical protein [Candidatus Eremiobacteraeota bacterium]ODT61591.1 MAG: hypothetical protein ABS71_16835 [bacterium SCN 62-11]